MGYVFPGEMVDIGHGRGWMDRPAAESQWRIDAELGHPQQITEAGRFRWEQQAHYDNYLRYGSPIALHPDTPSIHQKGRAKDTNERLPDVRHRHGWRLTVYRYVNGVWTLIEPWHEEYFPELDLYLGQPASDGSTAFPTTPTNQEDEMLAIKSPNRAPIALSESAGKPITLTDIQFDNWYGRKQECSDAQYDANLGPYETLWALNAERMGNVVWGKHLQAQNPDGTDRAGVSYPASAYLPGTSARVEALLNTHDV